MTIYVIINPQGDPIEYTLSFTEERAIRQVTGRPKSLKLTYKKQWNKLRKDGFEVVEYSACRSDRQMTKDILKFGLLT